MDSFGDRLRESRESQSYTLDQIARDTRISKRYLEALEKEDFSVFPGETYLVGFLRNYTQYLGLDSDEFISLYKNIKIQEQPIPMDELIHGKTKTPPFLLVAGIVVGALVVAVGGFFLFRAVRGALPKEIVEEEPQRSETTGKEFVFDSESETRWFTEGETIRVALGDAFYKIEVTSIDDNVTLSVPGGMVRMELSETRFVDLNLDSKNDLKLVFNDIDTLTDTKRVNLWMIKTATLLIDSEVANASNAEDTAAETTLETTEDTASAQETSTAETTEETAGDTVGTQVTATDAQRTVVLEADSPRIFKVEINFRGNCLFRYILDGETRDQRFFQKSESFDVDNVRREVQFWISNAGVLDTRIEGVSVNLGRSGQVVTKSIRWARNEGTGRYQLEVMSVY